jgi:menaquinone-dependent protoporphyrinogen oxidase
VRAKVASAVGAEVLIVAGVLVAYATKYGSTREVAERVATVLEEMGHTAEVRAAPEVGPVEGFSAVVLGGALYYFRLHRDARRFLKSHRRELEKLPVAVFAMGPFNNTTEEFDGARQQLAKALGKFDWLQPASTQIFGGAFSPEALRFPDNNPAMKKMEPVDIRDWDAIDEWARSLPGALGLDAGGSLPLGAPT